MGLRLTSDSNAMRISCKTSEGVEELIERIDKVVLRVTGCKRRRLQLKFSSPAVAYLYKEGFVTSQPTYTDSHLIFDVFMNDAEFSRFQKSFACNLFFVSSGLYVSLENLINGGDSSIALTS
ncbi:hypothetical protein KIN20_000363 [Parelaphostrongylus tenuis]|uniref:Uncharacterized protein n=1 Tax=Parelaphostrongylus tenuis TaxID=148309 RepID=A0AAD5LVC5_PARTN|nr:hypothetical protein KIN20_000363 [Parelaphostrongylus tenuis]